MPLFSLSRLVLWLGKRKLVQRAISPLTKTGGWLDFTSGPMAGGAAIPQEELEGYPECEHDVGLFETCDRCYAMGYDYVWGHGREFKPRPVHHYRNWEEPFLTTEKFGRGDPVASWAERELAKGFKEGEKEHEH